MPQATFQATLQHFKNGLSIQTYVDRMQSRGLYTSDYHRDLVRRLAESAVLI
jgi:hypothetical protein